MAFILLKYLTKSELQEFCVSYDNFCNLSRLKLFKSSLPLEPPMDKLWCSINNVIDDLNKGQQQGINSQSLEDTQVGYISQKYTLDQYTLEEYTLENF